MFPKSNLYQRIEMKWMSESTTLNAVGKGRSTEDEAMRWHNLRLSPQVVADHALRGGVEVVRLCSWLVSRAERDAPARISMSLATLFVPFNITESG